MALYFGGEADTVNTGQRKTGHSSLFEGVQQPSNQRLDWQGLQLSNQGLDRQRLHLERLYQLQLSRSDSDFVDALFEQSRGVDCTSMDEPRKVRDLKKEDRLKALIGYFYKRD